jgi:hypothetical protein
MKVKDLYNMLDNFYGLKGLTLVDGDDYIMYTVESLGMCYLEKSNIDIIKFTWENKYLTVYI